MDAARHHPKALPFLFLTEMWERFGFYVVQGLLVLYMTKHFGFSDNESYSIQGAFTALAYISPIVGGLLADRLLGSRTSILWGGIFLVLGYVILTVSSSNHLLYVGLATIIAGNGLFKPNISSLLGAQYTRDDPRRDSGFTIFYIGINLGAGLAGLSSGYIREYFGWHVSFAIAAVGLLIGLATFLYGLKYIKQPDIKAKTTTAFKFRFLALSALAIAGIQFMLKVEALSTWLLPSLGIILLVYLTMITLQQDKEFRKNMILLNTLIISSIVFWMIYWQIFFSVNLFIDRLVDKEIMGIHLSTTVFYASESIFILLLGPIFAWSWQTLGRNDRNPSPINKFVFGLVFAGLGFIVLGASTMFPDSTGLINPLWIFLAYLLITIGELLLSPIGLSAVTTLAPTHLVGLMMGVWFVATGFGGIFAGVIAKFASIPDTVTNTAEKLAIYQDAFFNYAYLAFFVAIILFFAHLGVKRVLR